jgi:hypothetical protein
MKTLRLLTILIVAVLVVSAWAPAPAYSVRSAKDSHGGASLIVNAAKAKAVKLVVTNRTGGSLYVRLSGPKSYYFSTSKPGKATFLNIQPGRYVITVRASTCGGTLTYTRNMKGTVSLKPFVCK